MEYTPSPWRQGHWCSDMAGGKLEREVLEAEVASHRGDIELTGDLCA